MKRLIASAVLLSAILVVPALFVGMSSTALAAGTLTVEKPYGSRELVAGFSYFITWSPGNAGATVKIELLKLNKHYKWITKKTGNDGEFIWKIPKSVAKGSKYKIRITSTNKPSITDKSIDLLTIFSASSWWKEDFDDGWATSLGIEDDGGGTWGDHFTVHGNSPPNRHNVNVVNKKDGHPVRKGKQSTRLEIRPGDCGGDDCKTDRERTELMMDATEVPGKEYWYAWSVYFKNYKTIQNIGVHHGQWKQLFGPAHMFPTFTMMTNGLNVEFGKDFGTYKKYLVIPNKGLSNKWHDFRVHTKWSTASNGFFKLWRNGKLLIDRKGKTVSTKHEIAFRFGIYRPFTGRAKSNITHIVYYDELVRGNSCDDVSQFMTCPGGSSLKVTSPNGKEKWKTQKKYSIKWKKGKAGTYVKIQLLKKGKLYKTIAAKTKNDGKHAWRVPSTLVKSAAYKIKITSTKNKKLNDSSDKNFTITK